MFLSGWGSSQVLPAQDFLKQTRLRDHRMHARSRSRLAYNHIYLLGRTCTMSPARVSQAGPIPCCLLVRRLTVCATTTSPHHQHAISQHATTTTTTASQQHTKHTIMPNHLVNHAATLRRLHVTTPTRQHAITPSRHHAITQPHHTAPPMPSPTTTDHHHTITPAQYHTIVPLHHHTTHSARHHVDCYTWCGTQLRQTALPRHDDTTPPCTPHGFIK